MWDMAEGAQKAAREWGSATETAVRLGRSAGNRIGQATGRAAIRRRLTRRSICDGAPRTPFQIETTANQRRQFDRSNEKLMPQHASP